MKSLLLGVPHKLQHNFVTFYWDIAAWGLYTGSTLVFLTVYATRAGATSAQIGLLSAGPAIVSLLLSIPAGLLARRVTIRRGIVLGAFFARASLVALVFIPSLVPPAWQVNVLIGLTVLLAMPNTMVNICFGPLFMGGIPPESRATVVGTRNAINAIISFAVTLICGQLLTHLPSPLGYQVVFFIGFVGAALTIYTLGSIQNLFPAPRAEPVAQRSSTQTRSRNPFKSLFPSHDANARHYLVVVLMLTVLNTAAYMAAPLTPLFTINQLHLNDGVISIGSAASNILVFLVSLSVARMTSRFGNRNLTAMGTALLCFQTLILAMAHDASLFIVSSVIAGIASGMLSAASFNYHLENVPRLDQTVWISWNIMLSNMAVLLGSFAGPALAGMIGIPASLAVVGGIRLLLGVAIYLWG
ncbi:MAG TPA: MFS transporter [Anaerolineae bacterium]